jgi:uncharacterized metal-binding protein
MQCLSCNKKACKSEAKDCNKIHDPSVLRYQAPDNREIYLNADFLTADGRAGTLSRFEEIVLFAEKQGYKEIALAYCFSMEKLAEKAADALKKAGFKISSVRCSAGGVRENEAASELGSSVGCNPIGQALCINQSRADFVIEMGLCLGHDVLFHQELKKPFTVFIVKDRKYNHVPSAHFE